MKKSDMKSAVSTASRLAIIGIGCLFPKAQDQNAYWANIVDGIDAITEIPETHWPVADYFDADQKSPDRTYGRRGGFLSPVDFNPMEFNIPPNVLEAIDTSQLLGLVAAGQALKDAGYGPERAFDKSRASVILGVTGTLELVIPLGARLGHPIWRSALKDAGVDDAVAKDVVERISDAYVPWQENSFPGLLGNVVAGRISKQFDLGGTNCVVDAACASSFSALHLASMELASGKSDLVVTGGVDTFNDIFMYMCFSKTPALSPTGDAKPFDNGADGTILGEGLGIVVLKRLEDAERDGDRIYAVIRGVGSSSDGKGDAIYAPSASGQKKALLDAFQNADVTPESIGLIEAHGTGTKVGDAVEVSALREVFGSAERPYCALGSVKSQIGHTKAAAGAAGLIKAALALHHKVIPPTIKLTKPQQEATGGATPFYLPTTKRPWLTLPGRPRRAGVSAFGFGGSNFHVVLEEHRSIKEKAQWDGNVQIISFSGTDPQSVAAKLEKVSAELSWQAVRDLAFASRNDFTAKASCRLTLVVERLRTNLFNLKKNALGMLAKKPDTAWQTPDGAFFSVGSKPGKLGVLFPGQGAQYVGMLNDLACTFPEMLETLALADGGFADPSGALLSDFIYPQNAFGQAERDRQEESLRGTRTAQPALGAVSLGALKVLASFGFAPEAAAGHSYGELTALCASGVIDEEALFELSRLRGSLMSQGTGGMLAVSADLAAVEALLAEEKIDLVLANRNAPSQSVLSGKGDEIKRAAAVLTTRGITCKELPVAAAFHSELVADAAAPFGAALKQVAFKKAVIPVFSNTSADIYPREPAAAKSLLANQLARPVHFVAEIEAMYAAGVRTFVEVGPGARLTGLVEAILAGREHVCTALDASNRKRSGVADLARVLAQLTALGYPVQLNGWDPDYLPTPAGTKKPALVIPICGANYVKPRTKKPAAPPVAASKPQGPSASPAAGQTFSLTSPVAAASPDTLADSLRSTRETMALLQKMQEETARLHLRFLEGQEAAGNTLRMLLEQQQRLVTAGAPTPQKATATFATPAPPVATTFAPPPAASTFVPETAALPGPVPQTVPVVQVPAALPGLPSTLVVDSLLAVISEKTGYPLEMLEMDMGMDSDLGIDSIKRVEILSALQERLPGAPVIGPEHLGTLATLGDIAAHLGAAPMKTEGPSHAGSAPKDAAIGISIPAASHDAQLVVETLLGVVSEKTGYPIDMLELDMGMDSDLGIDSIKRVEILSALQERLPGAPAIGPEHLGTLATLGDIVGHLTASLPAVPTAITAPAAPTASLPAPTASGPGTRAVTETLLAVVSEKTGYPMEMLELDMGMDSDLGIDSIKRVEILSALQERLPGAPVIGPEHLGTLATLGDIVRHLTGGEEDPAVTAAPNAPFASPVDKALVERALLTVVSEKTGYPMEMLELDMGMDSDLGIDSIKRVEILSALQERLPSAPVIGPEHLGTLATLGDIVGHLTGGSRATAVAVEPEDTSIVELTEAEVIDLSHAPIERSSVVPVLLDDESDSGEIVLSKDGVIWVTDDRSPFVNALCDELAAQGYQTHRVTPEAIDAAGPETPISGLIVCAPEGGTDDLFLKNAFLLLKNASFGLTSPEKESAAVFVTVSRLDGRFGFGAGTKIADPISGGLAGLAKTAAREWPELFCKAIDLGSFPSAANAAKAVAGEIFRVGPVEVGLSPSVRYGLSLAPLPQAPSDATAPFRKNDLVIITGGGRGVTAEAAFALAERYHPTLVLLGRTPEPAPEPSWLAGLTQESDIKRGIIQASVGKLHPREIEVRFRGILAQRELRLTMKKLADTGVTALYRSVDIRDRQAMKSLVAEIRRQHGPVRGIVHGAGVLADRLIAAKTEEQFEEVYGTKVAGLRALLQATKKDPLRFIALFSSSTGRFGRVGQVDYAVANEVLNKIAQVEARSRKGCRAVSINWGPWDGGMVTPALKKMFAEEGIGVIDLAEGGGFLAREIADAGAPIEIVALAAPPVAVASHSTKEVALHEAFALNLTVGDYPFLRSHVLDGKAVLPMAVIVEWLAHGALHGNPGFRFHGFNDLRICKGVVFEEHTPFTVNILAGHAVKRDSFHVVPVELCSLTGNGRHLCHARAEIVLAGRLPEGIRSITEIPGTPYQPEDEAIYTPERLFHGPDLQGIEKVEGCSAKGIAAMVKGAPAPASWIKQPLRSIWLTDPLALDCAFQMMILWSFERFGSGSLPCFAGRYRQFQESFPKEGVHVVVRVTSESAHNASADMEFLDRHTGKLVARLEGYECVIDPSLVQAFRRNRFPAAVNVALGAA